MDANPGADGAAAGAAAASVGDRLATIAALRAALEAAQAGGPDGSDGSDGAPLAVEAPPRRGGAGHGKRRLSKVPPEERTDLEHEQVARSTALRLLTGSPKSRHQLEQALAKKEVPPSVVAHVLDRFEAVGLVDDAAFAEMLVRTRHTERGLAGPALAQELRRYGVDKDTAAQAMEHVSEADELEAATALAAKKLQATRGLDRTTRLRRVYSLLARKGYRTATARHAIDTALAAEER
ncbi:MAG: recombination regulator RecX [Bifidobacteriaceae bacterium]|nr:recombination regulator RecX [Bifidobacteriaceae bacterium]